MHLKKQRKNLTLKNMCYKPMETKELDTSRTELLIGVDGVEKLKNKSIILVGVGGVGGYVATMLVRAGIGKIKLVDFDKVSSSNVNRQVVATTKTVGRSKVEVLKEMLLEINPKLDCLIVDERLTEDNVSKIITPCDMCIDAIDSVNDKVSLIIYCKKHNISIISAMGAGNRYSVPKFYLTDIYKTHDDGLAKVIRKRLRQEGIDSLDVVTSEDKALQVGERTIGSISYYPAMCGITISAIVINKILKEEKI